MNKIYKNEAAWDLIAKSISGNADEMEKESLSVWLDESPANRELYEECLLIWEKSDSDARSGPDSAEAWEKLKAKIAPVKIKKLSLYKQYLRYSAVAAMLSVAVLAYWLYPIFSNYISVENREHWSAVVNEKDEPKSIQMPDGSSIVLNKNASLRYPEKFEKREVELKGEAFFKVNYQPKNPFKIYVADSEIEVLGTAFNVKHNEKSADISVMVESGKVSFKNPGNQPILLLAGKGAHYNAEKSEIELRNNLNAGSWRTKSFKFQNTAVKDVIASLEEVYNLKISVSNESLLKCEFNGSYDKIEPENILHALSFSLGAELSFSDGVYLLNGEGCNN